MGRYTDISLTEKRQRVLVGVMTLTTGAQNMPKDASSQHEKCKQCQQWLNVDTSPHVVIRDKDTNEVGYLHRCCVRYYAHQRNFIVLEDHVH